MCSIVKAERKYTSGFRTTGAIAIAANRPEMSGTVPDLQTLSRVPHGRYRLLPLSRKAGWVMAVQHKSARDDFHEL